MLKRKTVAALVATTIMVTSAPIFPAFAQAQTPQMNAAGQVCQTFISNATPYGYVGVANVDLGAVFDSIDTISGTIGGTRTTGASTLTISATPPAGKWRNQGYKVPAWGPTGGWTSYTEYLGGAPSGPPMMQTDVIDVRFGTDDGLNPGKAQVPQGVQGLYVVQRNETGHAPLRLTIQRFNLTICGKPKVAQLPSCGIGPTQVGQQCFIYMIFQPNGYPGRPQNSFSLSTLPSSYPNIVRCERPVPLLNLTAPGNVKCMRKYKAVKLTPINSNLPVSDPSQGVEVFPPN